MLKSAVAAGLVVAFIMLLLQPTKLAGTSESYLAYFMWSVVLGLICSLFLLAHFILLPLLFPSFFMEKNWQVWKSILLLVSIIFWMGVASQAIDTFIFRNPFTMQGFLSKQYISVLIAFFPISILTLTRQASLLRKYRQGAEELNHKLGTSRNPSALPAVEDVMLEGDNQEEVLRVTTATLLFVQAADNYIQAWYLDNDQLRSRLLRSTLKKVSAGLETYGCFYRCHRSYIVNLDCITRLSGNAQGYHLELEKCSEKIPVSRNLNNELRDKLQKQRI
jgi:DNA-binding LytR/AlgR family response regulator